MNITVNLVNRAKTLAWQFAIKDSGITVIHGPSGSGKTTLLHAIAGLNKSMIGTLHMNDQCWQDSNKHIFIKTSARALGMVFQGVNLFPHLTVYRNLLLPYQHTKHRQTLFSLEDIIAAFNLNNFLTRKPSTLSGGEAQRIAVARSFLTQPALLLFDEPLSALDDDTKKEMMDTIKKLRQQANIPILYVTHSKEELSHLASTVLLIKEGKIKSG